jgi:hypothetical protein
MEVKVRNSFRAYAFGVVALVLAVLLRWAPEYRPTN